MANNWIDEIISECEHVETPRSWLWWSLCNAISAAAANQYYLRTLKGAVLYKPNLYTILLGESGLGKAFPIVLAKTLLTKADCTRVIYGRSSIQAIVQDISMGFTRPGKEPITDSRAAVINGELSTAIIQDPDSLTILTDLYDCPSDWINRLKGSGKEKLKDVYLTCLFGSSPAHFHESIPLVNIEGGYIGRNLIVLEERRYKDTDLLDDEDPNTAVEGFPFEKYVNHLKYVAFKSGRIIPNFDAKMAFNDWRKKWRANQKADKTGFLNRVPDHVLKVAMCLALAEPDLSELVIRDDHIETAIDKVTSLTYANRVTSEGRGADPLAPSTKHVLDLLIKAPNHELKRKQLLQRGYGVYDVFTLDKVIETLSEADWVEKERFVAGANSDWVIKLKGEPLAEYKRFLERRKDGKK